MNTLAARVIEGYTDNPAVFPNPQPPIISLTAENDKLAALISEAKGNHLKTVERNEQCKKVYDLLNDKGKPFVNGKAKGDEAIILLSGFFASKTPQPRSIPAQVVIKRIADGAVSHSAKIFLAKITSPLNEKSESLIYTVQMADGSLSEFRTVLQTTNQRKLVITNLVRAREVFFRIAASNSRGQGDWSDTVPFIGE